MSSESSDYSDSGDEGKKKVEKSSDSGSGSSGSDSDSEVEKRPSREVNAKKQSIIESGGDSDLAGSRSDSGSSSGGESEDEGPSHSRKRSKKSSKKVPSKKRRAAQDSGDEEDEERPNRELFETEEEYAEWRNMNEKEREQEIFNRIEKIEMKKTREQIEQKLKAKHDGDSDGEAPTTNKEKKKERRRKEESRRQIDSEDEAKGSRRKKNMGASSDSDMDAEFHRPSDISKKNQQKKAMQHLVQKRKDKEKKDAKHTSLSIHDVFGGKEGESNSSSSSSESSSESSSSSSRESSPTRRRGDEEKSAASKKPVDAREDLLRCRLSRFKLAKLVHAPFFADVATGAYVRIQTGPIPGSKSTYRIGRVHGVVETAKVYNLAGGDKLPSTRTNKGLKLRWGKHERVYRMEFVSNSEFPDDEFLEWKAVTMQEDTLPTMDHVAKKQKEILKAMNHSFTNKEIDLMMKEKARFNKTPRNFAMTKGELMKQKEYCEQTGDTKRVQELQRQIEELDSRADRLDKARSADISAVTWINQRNRNMMKKQFLGDNLQFDMVNRDDPFTRKKDRMKVVGSGRGKREAAAAAAASQLQDSTVASSSSSSQAAETVKAPPVAPGMHLSKSANDLFDLHAGLGKIDIDIDIAKLTGVSAFSRPMDDFDTPTPAATSSTPHTENRRLVSLDDYRKRRAAAATQSSQ